MSLNFKLVGKDLLQALFLIVSSARIWN